MKLKTKLFIITDSADNDINLDEIDVILILNGEKTSSRVQDVFSELEFEDGSIKGNSLLSYYNVNDDGSLSVEGSNIKLLDETINEPILIKSIKRPFIHDDTVIPFEHVQKFAEFFTIAKPDEVFTDLTDEEKQFFITARNARLEEDIKAQRELRSKEIKAAEQELADKQKEAEALSLMSEEAAKEAVLKEKELKASINPKFVNIKKDYLANQNFYRSIDFKEYVDGFIHLFYGKSDDENPFVLIKRGADWWEEPQDTQIADETDTTIVIEFTDGETLKQINLDITTGETTVRNAEA